MSATRGGIVVRFTIIAAAILALPITAQAEDMATAKRTRLAVCERADWNPELNEDAIDPCVEALAFNPSIYFGDEFYDADPISPFPNLVDARFWHPFNGIEWAFAIDSGCPQTSVKCGPDERHFLLRATTGITREEMSAGWEYKAPQSKADAQRLLSGTVRWREADLNECPGALAKLRSLEDVRWMSFDSWSRNAMEGKPPGEFWVIADGYTVEVRTSAMGRSIAMRDKGDGPGGWAMEMLDLVEPCLKPTAATPTWER